MHHSTDLSFESGNVNVCQNCGKVAFSYEEATANQKASIGYAVLGWVFSLVSLLFVPILFGALAFVLGLITYQGRSKAHGVSLMIFSSIAFVLGSLLSFVVSGTMFL